MSIIRFASQAIPAAITVLTLERISLAKEDDHDFELWTWEAFTIDLSPIGLPDGTNLYLENANRFNNDASNMFQFHQRIGVEFQIPRFDKWSLMTTYQHLDMEPGSNEERVHFDLFYRDKQLFDTDWNFQFRFRWDIRDIDGRDEISYRLRPLIAFLHPIPLSTKGRPIPAYLMKDVNYDTYVRHFNRYRFGTGLNIPLNQTINYSIGYLLETNRLGSGHWDSDSALTMGSIVKF